MLVTVAKDVISNFIDRFKLKLVESSEQELLFLDTYFGELLKSGHYIVQTKHSTELKTIDSRLIAKEENTNDIRFFWDFKTKRLQELLRNIIEYRALMVQNRLNVAESAYLALNESEKGVFRAFVYIFDNKSILGIEPIKGYDAEFMDAKEFLSQHQQVTSLFDFVKKDVLPKRKVRLQPDMSAKSAMQLLLSNMYENMVEQEHGIVQNIDSEFLHYYRVYLRKARSVLSQLKGVFSDEEIAGIKSGLSEIGRATNHARDLDVYWLKVRDYAQSTSRSDFEPFLEFLKSSSAVEYDGLAKFLKSSKYKKIVSDFAKLIKAKNSKGARADEQIIVLAIARLKKLYKKLIRDGQNIDINSEDEKLHALRIDCKKMRYLLEFFESILDKERVGEAVRLIKNLQTILGNYQDLSVQQLKIVGFADEMVKKQDNIQSATLIAIGILVADLLREQKDCKAQFLQAFGEMTKLQNKEVFIKLFTLNTQNTNTKSIVK
jgi:CHAD domain-containing protein